MREYFLDPNSSLTGINLYLWPYPSDETVLVRVTSLIRWGVHDQIIGDVLKFFPLAFWLVYEAPPNLEYSFARLPLEAGDVLDEEVTLEIPLTAIPERSWPERPRPDELVLSGSERSYIGRPVRQGGNNG
jgi:hypothetical protein